MAAKKTRGKGEGSVFKDSRGYWTVVIELPPRGGNRRRKKVRSKDKQTAMEKAAVLRLELAARGDLPTHSPTVEQWLTHWLENIASKSVRPNTMSGYRAVTNKYVIPIIGKKKLDKIQADDVRAVTDYMVNELGMSSTSALIAHRTMSSSFETALRENKIYRNPAKLLDAPRKAVANLQTLDVSEAMQVLEHVFHDEENGARWATALLTGARRGEVIGIEVDRVGDDLDLSWQIQRLSTGARGTAGEVGKPSVPADFEYRHLEGGLYLTRPKSKAGWRIIPLVDPLAAILSRHMELNPPAENGLVFHRKGRPIDPAQDSKDWRKVLAATGIDKDVRLHDLRHTTVELLYAAGVPEDIIVMIVGHSTVMQTRSYRTRRTDPRIRDAMALFSKQFTRLDGARSETRALDA